MNRASKYIAIGQILKPQGLKGELKVNPLTDDLARFTLLKKVLIQREQSYVSYDVLSVRTYQNMVFLSFCDIPDRNAAVALRNAYLWVERKDAVPLQEGRYYICDVMGCMVIDEYRHEYGTVEDIIQTGSNDVYIIDDKKGKQWMLPALKSIISAYDVENGFIHIKKAGLLEVETVEN